MTYTRQTYIMKCGCQARSMKNGQPYCDICDCDEIAEIHTDGNKGLENRKAICLGCRMVVPSDWGLPYFKYRKNSDMDTFYCGCDD